MKQWPLVPAHTPAIIISTAEASSFLLQAPVTAEHTLTPSMTVLVVSAMGVTVTERQWLITLQFHFSSGRQHRDMLYVIFQRPPCGIEVQVPL